jgi:lactaldehyde reductase
MRNWPRIALVDPDLTFSCPPPVTAAVGMDALSHAVDSLHCRLATPASDAKGLEGARLVGRYIRARVHFAFGHRGAVRDGTSQPDRGTRCRDHRYLRCACAGRSHGWAVWPSARLLLRGQHAADHGVQPAGQHRETRRLAFALGVNHPGYTPTQQAEAAVAAIRDLCADLDVPHMRDLIRAEDPDVLAGKAEANTSTPSNPRAVTSADYHAMFAREMAMAARPTR